VDPVHSLAPYFQRISPSPRPCDNISEHGRLYSELENVSYNGDGTLYVVILDYIQPACLSARFLLALAITMILGSESHGTYDHILLSDSSGSLQTLCAGLLLYSFRMDLIGNTTSNSSSFIVCLYVATVYHAIA
jgi:hypothetical protein